MLKKSQHNWLKTASKFDSPDVNFADWAAPFIYGKRNKYLAQLFQALRIAVNEELQSLQNC